MVITRNKNKDVFAINIKDIVCRSEYLAASKFYCNLCSRSLIIIDPHKGEWFCNTCRVSYFPNKGQPVKRPNKFETPGDKKKAPIVAMINDSTTVRRPRPSVFPRSLEPLKRPGVNITEFSSTVDGEGV